MSISLILIGLGLSIIIFFGFKTSIEYTGGSVIKFTTFPNYIEKSKELSNQYNFRIVELFERESLIHLKTNETDANKIQEIISRLREQEGVVISDIEVIGSSVGLEFAKNSFLAFVIALLGIFLYITYSFKNISDKIPSWNFGIAAIVAIFHDILIVVSFFSLAGYLFNVEIDALFLTSLLTIAGFSINDTIVVFDRIRENLLKYQNSKSYVEVFNISILETLNRSLITSFTVIIIMFSLFLLGAGTIKYFALSLVIGISVGTYSSIFIASPLVLLLQKFKK
jgi:preprotein translocase subunit SecF